MLKPSPELTAPIPSSIKFAGVATFVLVAIYVVASRAAPFLLPLLAIIPLSLFMLATNARAKEDRLGDAKSGALSALLPPLTPLLAALILFGAYLLLNSAWSPVPAIAYGKAALFLGFLALVSMVSVALPQLSAQTIERLSLNVLLAAGIFSLYIVIEVYFGAPIKKLILSFFPFLVASDKHIAVNDGWVTRVNAYVINRNVGAFTLIFWPLMMMSVALLGRRKSIPVNLLLVTIIVPMIIYSEHESSKLAILLSGAVFLLTRYWPNGSLRLVATGWLIATLLVVPIALYAFNHDLHKAEWLPDSAKERVIIWATTAKHVSERPFLGAGVQSIKPNNAELMSRPGAPKEFGFSRGLGRHTHNVYLQSWYELGAIGVLLFCTCGLLMLRTIGRLEPAIRPYVLAAFTGAATMASFSYGMWQPWFMASYGIAALLVLLAMELCRGKSRQSS